MVTTQYKHSYHSDKQIQLSCLCISRHHLMHVCTCTPVEKKEMINKEDMIS